MKKSMKKIVASAMFLLPAIVPAVAQHPNKQLVNQNTPSYAEYFSWVNNTNEGTTESNTFINFDFFQWMKERYGMQLDIYAFDAGAIDGAKMYGDMSNSRFMKHFPNGFAPIANRAKAMGMSLGLWGGPDGFGTTDEEAKARIAMMKSLVTDFNFRLFKLDAVCGQLREDKYEYFDNMMTEIRNYAPDFIFLNHRLQLGKGTKHSTTYLLGGDETYIDVHMSNDMTAPHHRAKALARKLPEGLTRLTEDHGVCLSSCLDGWEDDLILQAFNRNLIMAPQIYANPWLLRDEELSYLAYIFNLHRDYRDILVAGKPLPEAQYGPEAVTRGDGKTQFITLRNLTWNTKKYKIKLDSVAGLENKKDVKVRLYHPYILDLGTHAYGSEVEVEVLPFASSLVKLTTDTEKDRVALSGIPYQIINDRTGNSVEIKLLGEAGHKYSVKIERGAELFSSAQVEGKQLRQLLNGGKAEIAFTGEPVSLQWHRQVGRLTECPVPEDISSIYWATCFAADNNALECRSLQRAGETGIDVVQKARDAFFNQNLFREREIWDKYMFDGDPTTAFSISMRWGDPREQSESSFCLDLGKEQLLDSLTIHSFDEYSIIPLKSEEGVQAYVSSDMKQWKEITFIAGRQMNIPLQEAGNIRYIRFSPCPIRISEVCGYKDGQCVSREGWHASNLFRTYGSEHCAASQVWKSEFTLDHIEEGAYLCIAVNGTHGKEGAWAGLKIDGEYVGCPDRSVSFTSNTWEYKSANSDRNYTYYVPLTQEMKGKKIEAYVMLLRDNEQYVNTERPGEVLERPHVKEVNTQIDPEVWVTAHHKPYKNKVLVLK
ncbi:MAG: hypothetical protein ACI30I_09110 [Parabacteroides sp.]